MIVISLYYKGVYFLQNSVTNVGKGDDTCHYVLPHLMTLVPIDESYSSWLLGYKIAISNSIIPFTFINLHFSVNKTLLLFQCYHRLIHLFLIQYVMINYSDYFFWCLNCPTFCQLELLHLSPLCFWHYPFTLWVFPCFLAQESMWD